MSKTINLSSIKNILVLGDGKTANAVKNKIIELNNFTLTSNYDDAELMIISPGINPKNIKTKSAVPLISEIEFAYLLFQYFNKVPKFITITGTNGKTTTTDLVSQLLMIPSAGNIGYPLINFVSKDLTKIPNVISLELSSYQLETSPCFKPDIYILLNITEDHLDRHGTMEEYAGIKLKTLSLLTEDDCFIYNSKDLLTMNYLNNNKIKAQIIDIQNKEKIQNFLEASPLLGEHNLDNLSAAIYASSLVDKNCITLEKIKKLKPYPHRLEKVKEINSITFINDSKATNPDSTIAALNSIQNDKIILLLGGEKKSVSYEPMFKLIKKNNIRSITFGAANQFFYEALQNTGITINKTNTLREAVLLANKQAKKGDIILLSPACASFDMYNNFEERGNEFKQIVSTIPYNK